MFFVDDREDVWMKFTSFSSVRERNYVDKYEAFQNKAKSKSKNPHTYYIHTQLHYFLNFNQLFYFLSCIIGQTD